MSTIAWAKGDVNRFVRCPLQRATWAREMGNASSMRASSRVSGAVPDLRASIAVSSCPRLAVFRTGADLGQSLAVRQRDDAFPRHPERAQAALKGRAEMGAVAHHRAGR